jgi:hypothetical protein
VSAHKSETNHGGGPIKKNVPVFGLIELSTAYKNQFRDEIP